MPNLIGKRFGRVIIIEQKETLQHRPRYLVRCDCGNEFITRANSLQTGRTQSCGCLHKQKCAEKRIDKFERLLNQYRYKAKQRKLTFDITSFDIKELMIQQNARCAITNIKLYFNDGRIRIKGINGNDSSKLDTNISIDRIENSKGYERTNIQLVTKEVNMLKGKRDDKLVKKIFQSSNEQAILDKCT